MAPPVRLAWLNEKIHWSILIDRTVLLTYNAAPYLARFSLNIECCSSRLAGHLQLLHCRGEIAIAPPKYGLCRANRISWPIVQVRIHRPPYRVAFEWAVKDRCAPIVGDRSTVSIIAEVLSITSGVRIDESLDHSGRVRPREGERDIHLGIVYARLTSGRKHRQPRHPRRQSSGSRPNYR